MSKRERKISRAFNASVKLYAPQIFFLFPGSTARIGKVLETFHLCRNWFISMKHIRNISEMFQWRKYFEHFIETYPKHFENVFKLDTFNTTEMFWKPIQNILQKKNLEGKWNVLKTFWRQSCESCKIFHQRQHVLNTV